MTVCKKLLFGQLDSMGISAGDTLLVNFNIAEFGHVKGFKRADYVNFLLEYLGSEGTIVALSYTNYSFSFFNKKLPIFTPKTPANTGAFPNALLKMPQSFRSLHPTHSVVSVGKNAEYITADIDHNNYAFDFYRKLIELDAKVLLIGCRDYPGFVTHLAELELGLYKKFWFGRFLKCRLESGDIFTRTDVGGCSSTFGRLYPYYIQEGILTTGYVGNAYSLSINAKQAYSIDLAVLKDNPSLIECNRAECFSCRYGKWRKLWRFPLFLLKKISRKFFS
jgi:aminoglycoside N3'-acetyltransferase